MPSPKDLQQSGLKATMPRIKILEVFEKRRDEHLTADDVYRILVTDGLDIGLATVYRALTQFEQAGLLQKQNFESGKAVFELNRGDHHDHLSACSATAWWSSATRKSKRNRQKLLASWVSRFRRMIYASTPSASTLPARTGLPLNGIKPAAASRRRAPACAR
jgi:hypothetical protein